MKLVTVGLNHKTAPVEVRERFAIPDSSIGATLAGMMEFGEVRECAIISTCNRVEIYTVSRDGYASFRNTKNYLAQINDSTVEDIDRYLYGYRGFEAVRHLFRVASSLDSMVLGEPQILGQVKDAYENALKFNTTGTYLNRLFPKAFSVAKKVRSETGIASSAVSVSYAAVELSRKIFSQLGDKTVLLIGAGEMCELAARHLISAGVNQIMVTNRTFERAVKLANEFDGSPVRFEEYKSSLKLADIIISSTGAPGFLINRDNIDDVIRERRNRPMFLIDMAVPRDIDPSCNEVDNVYLYDIDDLQSVVDENMDERKKEAKKAEDIIHREVGQFKKWFETYRAAPIIVDLRNRAEHVREAEVEKAIHRLKDVDEKTLKVIEGLSRSLMNKFLHDPITALKNGEGEGSGINVGEAIRKVFNLEEGKYSTKEEEKSEGGYGKKTDQTGDQEK